MYRMFILKVLKVTFVLICVTIQSYSTKTVRNSSFDALNYEDLRQYTAIAHCLAKINDEFSSCNQKANETGRQILTDYKIDSISDLPQNVKCCGLIALTDCWMNAANDKCTHNETVLMKKLPLIIISDLRNQCQYYLFYPNKCSTNIFNLWQILTFLLLLPISAFLIIFAVVFWLRGKNNSYSRAITF